MKSLRGTTCKATRAHRINHLQSGCLKLFIKLACLRIKEEDYEFNEIIRKHQSNF